MSRVDFLDQESRGAIGVEDKMKMVGKAEEAWDETWPRWEKWKHDDDAEKMKEQYHIEQAAQEAVRNGIDQHQFQTDMIAKLAPGKNVAEYAQKCDKAWTKAYNQMKQDEEQRKKEEEERKKKEEEEKNKPLKPDDTGDGDDSGSNGLVTFIVVILVLAVIGGVGYCLYKVNRGDQSKASAYSFVKYDDQAAKMDSDGLMDVPAMMKGMGKQNQDARTASAHTDNSDQEANPRANIMSI